MRLDDFMDVLGRLHKLTPAQKRAVAEVLAEPDASEHESERHDEYWICVHDRMPYGPSNKAIFDDAAYHWPRQSRKEQDDAVRSIAKRFGRTEKAVRYQITSRLK